MRKVLFIYIIFVLIFPLYGISQEKNTYVLNCKIDIPVVSYSVVCYGVSHIIGKDVQPLEQAEIEKLSSKNLNKFDQFATKKYSSSLATAADYISVGSALLSVGSIGLHTLQSSCSNEFWKNTVVYATMYLETMAFVYSTKELTKNASTRIRPFVYNESVPIEEKLDVDARKSFFSGNTSLTAASTFYAASIISKAYPRQWQSYVGWTIASVLPIVVGVMRVESGNHFPTDVIAGYTFGAISGYLVPLLHRNKETKIVGCVYPNGLSVGMNL